MGGEGKGRGGEGRGGENKGKFKGGEGRVKMELLQLQLVLYVVVFRKKLKWPKKGYTPCLHFILCKASCTIT